MSFYGEVYRTLSELDVSAETEKKQEFDYLSWPWAWAKLMEHYPESHFENLPVEYHPDQTATVAVRVTIRGNTTDRAARTMTLPVLQGNKPVTNPNAFQLNTAYMRCLVKCLALFGLGLNIYAGEDLPMYTEDDAAISIETMVELLSENDQVKFYKACGSADGSPIEVSEVDPKRRRPAIRWMKERIEAAA